MFVHRSAPVNPSGVTALSRRTRLSTHLTTVLLPLSAQPLLREIAILVLVAVAALLVLRGPSIDQPFSIDESRWIATSRYFWITFVDRDLFGPAWQPNYLVYTHPPVARYLIGFGLWLQGWNPDQLNGRYDSFQSRAYNERAGNVPDLDLLWAARRVTLVFAVASVVVVYVVSRNLAGTLAGLATAAFALANPLLTTVWTRALAESIVAAFSLLALALALQVMPKVGTSITTPRLPLAVGAVLALAAAAKLNGALGALGLSVFAAIQQAFALVRVRRTVGLRSWLDVALSAMVVFVAINPLLYVMPADRIVGLIQHRQDEMEFQREVFNAQAVPDDLSARIARVGRRAFGTYALPRGPLPVSVDAVLVPVGLAVLGWRSITDIRHRRTGQSLLFMSWFGATYAVVTPNLGFDSSHYFAPLVALNVIAMGVAVAGAMQMSASLVRRLRARSWPRAGQNVQAPAR